MPRVIVEAASSLEMNRPKIDRLGCESLALKADAMFAQEGPGQGRQRNNKRKNSSLDSTKQIEN